jgi:hypothetical protein
LPDLGYRHHVQRVVEPPIPGAGEPMPNLLTGGRVDGGGAVIRREVIFRWEPVDRVDLGQNPAGDDRSDAVELGEPGAGAVDQRSDLRADGFHLRVQRPDVVEVLVRQLPPHHPDRVDRTEFGQ